MLRDPLLTHLMLLKDQLIDLYISKGLLEVAGLLSMQHLDLFSKVDLRLSYFFLNFFGLHQVLASLPIICRRCHRVCSPKYRIIYSDRFDGLNEKLSHLLSGLLCSILF